MLARAGRVTPPQPRKNWIVRQRALESLYAALDCRLILVVGGAGYGKTGLLAQFVATSDFTVAWLTIDSTDEDLRTFGESVVEALARRFAGFGDETRQLLQSASDIEHNALLLARTLARELEQHIVQPTCFILDDFHLIESSKSVLNFIDSLVAELPDDCHLIIASRSLPLLQLGTLISQQQVSALGQTALRLDLQETRDLLGSLRGVTSNAVTDADADKTYRETDGWLVGVLITNQIEQLRDAQLGLGGIGAIDILNDYLLTRVLRQLPEPLQAFLLRTSILDDISVQFCEKDLGWTDIREWIRETERRNLFIYKLESPPAAPSATSATTAAQSPTDASSSGSADETYRYHPLFREFLLRRFRDDDSLAFANVQRDVGLAYARNNVVDLALRHLFTGGWNEDSAQVLEANGVSLLQQGHNRKLLGWLDQLDQAASTIMRSRHVLLQYKLIASLNLGNDSSALNAVNALDELYARQNDLGRRDALGIYRGLLLCHAGRYQEALACGHVVINSAFPQQTLTRVEAFRLSALAQYEMGHLSQALALLTEAEQLVQSLGRSGWRQLVLLKHVKSFVLDSIGKCPQALLTTVEAAKMARELSDASLLALVSSRLACLLLYDRQIDKALYTASAALEMAEGTADNVVRAESLNSLSMVYAAQGEITKALEMNSAALQMARQVAQLEAGAQETLFAVMLEHCRLLALAVQREDESPDGSQDEPIAAALAMSREAAAMAEDTESTRRRLQAYTRIGSLQVLQREPHLALASLEHAASLRGEFSDNTTGGIALWQALALDMTDRRSTKTIRRAYDSVSAQVKARGQTYFIDAEGPQPADAYRRRTGQTLQLVQPRQGHATTTVSTNHVQKPQFAVVEHELCIRAFGTGQIWRGKEMMSPSDWQWNIPREIFFYILTFRRVSRDRIGLDFWPDASTTTLQNGFHSAKFAIRKALGKPGLQFRDGVYLINPELDYIYDVDEFRQWIAMADRTNPAFALTQLINAANLYHDDFLMESGYEWAANTRSQLREEYMDCCEAIGRFALQIEPETSDLNPALAVLQRALALDPLREQVARAAIHLNGRLGNRTAAVQTYNRLGEALQKELGALPEAETQALYASIIRT